MLFLLLFLATSTTTATNITLHVSTEDSIMTRHYQTTFTITPDVVTDVDIPLNITSSESDILTVLSSNITLLAGAENVSVSVTSQDKAGSVYVMVDCQLCNTTGDAVYLQFAVIKSFTIKEINFILGWCYFTVWSISFYPQIYLNIKRKSVVGLSFDFLGYNFLGWVCYSIFNFGLLWVEDVRNEYYVKYPHGVIPVQLSDFAFSSHALLITTLSILQCAIYERAGQKPSKVCLTVLGVFAAAMAVLFVVSDLGYVSWLEYITYFSYMKLAVTIFKYTPQIYINYRNKSTAAVSIYNFLLDLTGGFLSLVQMVLIAYNYNDWMSFIGDFTKLGLSLLTILYDFIFIFQHYVLYKDAHPYFNIENSGTSLLIESSDEE